MDFESEIARVIASVEQGMANSSAIRAFIDDDIPWGPLTSSLPIFGDLYSDLAEDDIVVRSYRDLVKKLLNDLRSLTRCLEAYLRDCACAKHPKGTEATRALVRSLGESDRSYAISFNYTSTFERMLKDEGIDCELCYVHGTIGDGIEKNTMLLGIDESVELGRAKTPVEFGPFKKYNQRIYKKTDSKYMTWLEKARSPHESIRQFKKWKEQVLQWPNSSVDINSTLRTIAIMEHEQQMKLRRNEVVIFGHSLGLTDRDILRSIITLPDTRTVVYYHDEEAFSSQVSNLSSILGTNEVIARTGGEERTLEFRDQRELA